MMRWRLAILAALAGAAVQLAACRPPYVDTRYVPVAQDYYRTCGWAADCTAAADALPLDQLYAVHLYGRSFHPWRGAAGHLARRGAPAMPFLKGKLGAARDGGEIASLFEVFDAMHDSGSFDVRGDAALIAAIQAAAHRVDDPGFFLRDQADELETGERRPFSVSVVGRRWLHPHGRDYDAAFARGHCRGCDFRDWKAGAEALPIDRLYALYRLGWEDFHPARNLEPLLAARGAAAIPFVKRKLAEADGGLMLMNLLSLLEMMRDLGTYDPARDPDLLRLVDAAVARGRDGAWQHEEAAARLRDGTPHPQIELRSQGVRPAR